MLDVERGEGEWTGVVTLWLDNAEGRNALAESFWVELPEAMAEVGEDPSTRALVLAARGRDFSVGLDLGFLSTLMSEAGGESSGVSPAARASSLRAEVRRLQAAVSSLERCPKPVIAAVHGYCIGGGVDLVAACDIRLAAADTIFSVRETRMAMVADLGSLQRLPGIIGRGATRELALTGDDFGAERALALGFANGVYADAAAVYAEARSMAARIARNSPLAVQGTKQVLQQSEGKSIEEGLDLVATWNAAFIESEDLAEAVKAFFEKRPPRFSGH